MHSDLERLETELARALEGLNERQTELRPQEDAMRWNIRQIVEHLRLTYGMTVVAMEARIAKGAPTKARPSLVQRVWQIGLIGLGYVPEGRKAPPPVSPASEMPPADGQMLMAGVRVEMRRMDALLERAEALFGSRRRSVSHMILGPLSIGQWCRFHLVHGRHHIRQIEAIRREYGL